MVDVANADVVAILTRAPSSGGKRRVFEALRMAPDPELLKALLLDTVDGVRDAGATLVIAVTPPDSCAELKTLVPDANVIAQPSGTLGDRMQAVMQRLFAAGARTVVLLGSDLPAVTPAHITAARAHLDACPDALVLGPAEDGGYYLVAATRLHNVFQAIDWSRADVLRQTMASAERDGCSVILAASLHDVDTLGDLARACADLPHSRTARWGRQHPL